MLKQSDVTEAAQAFGLADKPLEMHSSLRSFGVLEGGPDAVVNGLLAAGSTVLVPTFSTFHYGMAQPTHFPELCFERNALAELATETYLDPTPLYDTSSLEMNEDMGTIPRSVLARPDHIRGDHELNSFSAVGPLATKLISGQTSEDVYAPLRALVDADGHVVMMGVDLNRMTLIHFAEQVAGRNLFRRWVRDAEGNPKVVNIGSCSNGFERFTPVFESIERTEKVGSSTWRIFPASKVIRLAAQVIRDEPGITRCDSEDCARCPDAIAGGPILAG